MFVLVDDALIDLSGVERVHIEEAILNTTAMYGIYMTYKHNRGEGFRRTELIKVCDTKEQADAVIIKLASKLGAITI